MVPASFKKKYVIRFTVTSQYTKESDIERDWEVIQQMASQVLNENGDKVISPLANGQPGRKVAIKEPMKPASLTTKKDFGMSLLLFNVPMSPKFINGSFAALFDSNDIKVEFVRQFGQNDHRRRPMPLSPRRRLRINDKQTSVDSLSLLERKDPRFLQFYKQGSLDSKIEHIFDTLAEEDYKEVNEGESAITVPERPRTAPSIVNGTAGHGKCKYCGHILD